MFTNLKFSSFMQDISLSFFDFLKMRFFKQVQKSASFTAVQYVIIVICLLIVYLICLRNNLIHARNF